MKAIIIKNDKQNQIKLDSNIKPLKRKNKKLLENKANNFFNIYGASNGN